MRVAGASIVIVVLGIGSSGFAADPAATYLHSLSGFSGKLPLNNVRIFVDPARDEVYAADGETVRIFNAAGMETYRFGDGQGLGAAFDLAVDVNGDILALSRDPDSPADAPRFRILRRDYRGEPRGEIEFHGMPDAYADFRPNRMVWRDGRLWLLSRTQLRVARLDAAGNFETGIDLAALLEIPDAERADHEISGFALDARGNLLLSIPVLFRVFVVSPEGRTLGAFGKVGSAAGLFGVVAGVAGDEHGNVWVADRLRSVVMRFDREHRFVGEFGHFGLAEDNLVRPTNLALAPGGRLYVTQMMNRGVSVFSVSVNEP